MVIWREPGRVRLCSPSQSFKLAVRARLLVGRLTGPKRAASELLSTKKHNVVTNVGEEEGEISSPFSMNPIYRMCSLPFSHLFNGCLYIPLLVSCLSLVKPLGV